jgi:hypothetical protein
MTTIVKIPSESGFQEDKEYARDLRTSSVLPALEAGDSVQLDFSNVDYATQSFVHALIGEALKRYGVEILDRIEFHRCSDQLKSVIELVVNYSLAGFSNTPPNGETTEANETD